MNDLCKNGGWYTASWTKDVMAFVNDHGNMDGIGLVKMSGRVGGLSSGGILVRHGLTKGLARLSGSFKDPWMIVDDGNVVTHYARDKARSHDRIVRSVEACMGRYLCNIHPSIMRVSIGSDHAGFRLKERVKEHLSGRGAATDDRGTHSDASVDYPDFAHAVASAVVNGEAELGIVICGSGNGVNISANRHRGVRSALAWRPDVAALARQHNDANVLALPARFISEQEALAIVDAFVDASFEGGRHQRRVEKIEN